MIRRSLGLADKAKILIAVPLVSGLLFVGILFLALEQAERESREAERANAIFANGSIITTSLIEGFQALVKYRFSTQPEFAQEYTDKMGHIKNSLRQLNQLLKDKPKQFKKLKDLEELCTLSIANMDEARRLIELGETDYTIGEHAKDLKHLIGVLETRLQRLTDQYKLQGANAYVAQRRFRQQVKALLIIGIIIQFAIATLLLIAFSRGTLKQLIVLMDNIGKMNAGESLNPVLQGTDELSQMDQTFHMMAKTVSDTTEQLKLSEARTRAVIEGLPMGVAVLNEDFSIRFVNPAAEALFCLESEELSGRRISQLLADPKKKKGQETTDSEIVIDSQDHVREYNALRLDGSKIPLEITAREFLGPEGKMHLLGLVNISERHAIEQMKRDFVQMVTHDLRSPLTSIKMSGELMTMQFEDQLNDEWRRLLRVQDQNCGRLIGLINDLLDLEKLEAGMMTLELEPVTSHKLFELTLASVSSLAATKEINISWNTNDIELVADPDRLVQVLVNLVSNAIKFSERGQSIDLLAEPKDKWIEISVIDHGRGIPENKLPTIFERFTQVKKEDATRKGGTGLGLAICKSIIESHHGQIGVESESQKGSRFWFRIPAYSDQEDPDLD